MFPPPLGIAQFDVPAAVLFDNYAISDRVAASLATHNGSPRLDSSRPPSLSEALVDSILVPIYFDNQVAVSAPSVILAPLPILVSGWAVALSNLARDSREAEDLILDFIQGNPNPKERAALLSKFRLVQIPDLCRLRIQTQHLT